MFESNYFSAYMNNASEAIKDYIKENEFWNSI